MQKTVRFILVSIIALLLLGFVAIIGLITFINPNDFKPQITAKVQQLTGRTLTLNGEIQWSIFPWLGLQINDAALSNAPGFGDKPFAKIELANVKVKLLPLLKGNLNVGTLKLVGLNLQLAKNARGVSNWQDLTKNSNTETNPLSDTSKDQATKKSFFELNQLAISNIEIKESHLNWQDQQKNQAYEINNLNVNSKDMGFNEAFPVDIQFNLKDSKTGSINRIQLTSDITLNANDKTYQLSKLKLFSELNNKEFTNGKIESTLNGDVVANLTNETLTIKQLNAKIANLQLLGTITGQNILSKPFIQGNLQIPAFNLQQFLTALNKDRKPNNKVLQRVHGQMQIQATPDYLKLNNLTLNVDDSAIMGDAAVNNFAQKAITFNLNINQIDLNHFSTDNKTTQTTNSNMTSKDLTHSNDDIVFPVDTLKTLNMQGSIKIGQLKVSNIEMNDFASQLIAKNGLITINPISAKLYQGTYTGNLSLDVSNKIPKIISNTTLQNIEAEPLFHDLSNLTHVQVAGTANFNMHIATLGNNKNTLMHNLSGQGRFDLAHGILKGIDIAYWINVGKALARREAPAQANNSKQTPFDTLRGSFTANNGVINNHDLYLHARGIRITGQGNADLIKEYLNYSLDAQPLNPTTDKPQGYAIPIKVDGSFSNISVHPAVDKIIKDVAKEKIKEKVSSELEKRFGKDTGEQLKKSLDALFK